jgi:hypothetical protein
LLLFVTSYFIIHPLHKIWPCVSGVHNEHIEQLLAVVAAVVAAAVVVVPLMIDGTSKYSSIDFDSSSLLRVQ